MTEILLIRHAPSDPAGYLFGRSDVAARLPLTAPSSPLVERLRTAELKVSSPAKRCQDTARWLWQDAAFDLSESLWEQDFGGWEGLAYRDLPDLGALDRPALAAHRPPKGESFLDLSQKVQNALPALCAARSAAVVAHAGVIRAMLGLALGRAEDGLAFAIDPLSVTRLTVIAGNWAIQGANLPLSEAL